MNSTQSRCEYCEFRNGHVYRCKNPFLTSVEVSGETHWLCSPHAAMIQRLHKRIEQFKIAQARLETQESQTLEAIHAAQGVGY